MSASVSSIFSDLVPEPHCPRLLRKEAAGCFVHLAKSFLNATEAGLEAD